MAVVRLRTSLTGLTFAYAAGAEYPCSEDEAARLVAAGLAEPLEVEGADPEASPDDPIEDLAEFEAPGPTARKRGRRRKVRTDGE